jgi:hypothetical protein
MSALSHEVRFTLLADMPSADAKVRKSANNGLMQRSIFDEVRCNASASPYAGPARMSAIDAPF